MRPGALFCGRCGKKLAEAVKDEVKDQIRGKAEDLLTEKAKELLDSKAEPVGRSVTVGSTRNCPGCEGPVEPEWVVCPFCTENLTRTCPACGREMQPEWRFCPYCIVEL